MKKLIILILLLIASMAYALPGIDTVMVVGGLGTKADAAAANGGGATKIAWDAGSPTDFIGANGGPIVSVAAATLSADETETVFTDAGSFSGVTDGTLIWVDFDAAAEGEGYEDDYGYIISHTNDAITTDIVEFGTTGTALVNVGGAVVTLQAALDHVVNDATTYNRDILITDCNIAATIDADTNSGGQTQRLYVIGMNAAFTAEAMAEITTATTLADGLVKIATLITYNEWRNINFNGGGKDASRAATCVSFDDNLSDYHYFKNCNFYGASSNGFANQADYAIFTNCTFYDNGAAGYFGEFVPHWSEFIACTAYDNDTHGFYFSSGNAMKLTFCIAYGNGQDSSAGVGFLFATTADYGSAVNCTAYDNYGNGFELDDYSLWMLFANCTSVDNGGYGFAFGGQTSFQFKYFGHNHAAGNTGNGSTITHCSEVLDTAFATLVDGDNKAGTQAATAIFTDVGAGTEDFTPVSGSDLINNGIEAMSAGTQDIGAIQEVSPGGSTGGQHTTKQGGKQ